MKPANLLLKVFGIKNTDLYEGYKIPYLTEKLFSDECSQISDITDSLQLKIFLKGINPKGFAEKVAKESGEDSLSPEFLQIEFENIFNKYFAFLDNSSELSIVIANICNDLKNSIKRVYVYQCHGVYI